MKTVIMAGGKGTRISEVYPDIPKPLIPMTSPSGETKPVLEWEIESLQKQGFNDILLTVSHMHEKIEEYFGDGSKWGIRIRYFVEKTPLGNAGALYKIKDWLGKDDFLLLSADVVFDVDFGRFVRFHKDHNATASIYVHPNSHPFDSSIIDSDEDTKVIAWHNKGEDRPKWYKNLVNAGVHILNPDFFSDRKIDESSIGTENTEGKTVKVDLDRDILKPLCRQGKLYCYKCSEYIKDMGTPDRLEHVSKDFRQGIVASKNLSRKQKAIFLDRDGTINHYVGFLKNIDQFNLIDNAAEAIKRINESGYLAVVVTNQPVIARGEVTVDGLTEIHNKMETLLGEKGAYVDAIYYCPHHPDSGFAGEIKELKIKCECRKPNPGMLVKAAKDYNIDLENSWMIGDRESDVMTGINAGCHTALISDQTANETKAELVSNSLLFIFT